MKSSSRLAELGLDLGVFGWDFIILSTSSIESRAAGAVAGEVAG